MVAVVWDLPTLTAQPIFHFDSMANRLGPLCTLHTHHIAITYGNVVTLANLAASTTSQSLVTNIDLADLACDFFICGYALCLIAVHLAIFLFEDHSQVVTRRDSSWSMILSRALSSRVPFSVESARELSSGTSRDLFGLSDFLLHTASSGSSGQLVPE